MAEMLTIKEVQDAAKAKGKAVSGEYIRRMIAEGRIPGATKRTGAWFIPRTAALAWVERYVMGD